MLRGSDVPSVMTRVRAALHKAERAPGLHQPVVISGEGEDEIGIAVLRRPATLVTEFQSGSARPLVGRAIRFAKRIVRRALRWYVNPIAEQQSRFNHAVLDLTQRLRAVDERLHTEIEDQGRQGAAYEAEVERRLDLLREDVQRLSESLRPAGDIETAADMLPSTQHALHYRAFEDRHRGVYEDIRTLLSIYIPYFKGRRRVLDIGCGRGEFLQLMAEEGINAYGIDPDEGMVEAAGARGVEVRQVDAVTHLAELEPGAVDAIFSSQVVEHLRTTELVTMLDLAYRKLAPGGVIVLETPNPETLFIFSAFFYVDLTHVKPIHPEALKWAMESAGFHDIQIERILPVPSGARLDPLPDGLTQQEGWTTVAQNIERLNVLLYGPQHYAAVGRKEELHD